VVCELSPAPGLFSSPRRLARFAHTRAPRANDDALGRPCWCVEEKRGGRARAERNKYARGQVRPMGEGQQI
jgi:hypothetical protein